MKNLKTKTMLVALLFGGTLFSTAQENARFIKSNLTKSPNSRKLSAKFALGFANTVPSSTTKEAYITNSSGVSGDVSIPFASFRKGWDGTVKGKMYTSLNIGGLYNFGGSGNPSSVLPSGFAIAGQTSSSVIYRGVDPKNPGFRLGIGPQVNFILRKFTISPMVLAEYFSMTQKELSAVQTTQYNGQTLQYNLFTLPETKTCGLAITPKVRVHYMITQSFGLFVDGSYILGPKVSTQLSSLVPEGNPNQQGQYNQQQLDNGTMVKGETKSTSYTAVGVNVGLTFSFKTKKGWNGVAKSDDKGWNGVTETQRKGWDGTVKGGKMTKTDSGLTNNKTAIVTRKNEVSLSNSVTVTVNYSGKKTSDQLPIIEGSSVTGNISNMPKGTKIKIIQSYSGDEGSAITDENGNFSILLNHDTVHVIFINDEEYGKIKIEGVTEDLKRKGWDGTVKGGIKITSPTNGEELENIPTFRWTPLVPKSQEPITYRLKVWQLMQGQNGTQAMKSNNPLLDKDVTDVTEFTASNLYTGPCKPPYMCNFIWTVQALDKSGKELNNCEPAQFSFRKGWNGKQEATKTVSDKEYGKIKTEAFSKEQNIDDCCTGSRWDKKQISWDLLNHDMLSKEKVKSNNNRIEEINTFNKRILNGDLIATPLPLHGEENVECGEGHIYHLLEGDTRTFSGSFSCNPSLPNCKSEVLISIKTLSGNYINVVNQSNSVLQIFTLAGEYEVTYTAMCGGKKCDECIFKVIVDKNCCPAIKTKSSTITTRTRAHLSTTNLTFPPINSYKSSSDVKVNLYYSCPQSCSPTYIYTRAHKNSSGVFVIVPSGGGSGTSPLSITVPASGEDRITILMKCGTQVCSSIVESFIISNWTISTSLGTISSNIGDIKNNNLPACNSCDAEGSLVTNGNFESGNTGFTSGLTYSTGAMGASKYFVNGGTSYPSISSKSGIGNYYNIQAYYNHLNELSGKTIWKNTIPIPVKAGSKYAFCFDSFLSWESNPMGLPTMTPGNPLLEIEVLINGVNISSSILLGTGPYTVENSAAMSYHIFPWQSLNFTWIATSTAATIELKFKSKSYPQVAGWNFGLDDIIFKECN